MGAVVQLVGEVIDVLRDNRLGAFVGDDAVHFVGEVLDVTGHDIDLVLHVPNCLWYFFAPWTPWHALLSGQRCLPRW